MCLPRNILSPEGDNSRSLFQFCAAQGPGDYNNTSSDCNLWLCSPKGLWLAMPQWLIHVKPSVIRFCSRLDAPIETAKTTSISSDGSKHGISYGKYSFSVIHLNSTQLSESEGPRMAEILRPSQFLSFLCNIPTKWSYHLYGSISHDGQLPTLPHVI